MPIDPKNLSDPYIKDEETGLITLRFERRPERQRQSPVIRRIKSVIKSKVFWVILGTGAVIASIQFARKSPEGSFQFEDRFNNGVPTEHVDDGGIKKESGSLDIHGSELVAVTLKPADQRKLFTIEKRFLAGERGKILAERDALLAPYGVNAYYWVSTKRCSKGSSLCGTRVTLSYSKR